MSAGASVFVEAPSRLHFGVLDLRGSLGRRFGGLGAAIPSPSLLVEVAPLGDGVTAEGPDAERAAGFARRFLEHHGLRRGARVVVHRRIPAHSGLGSGTQLGLSVARALAELHGLPAEPTGLARAVSRGRRSAIGTWAFALGGFIVEGGRRPGDEGVAPLIGRYEMPAGWRCVVAVPPGRPGLSGEAEATAFARLPPPPDPEVERVSHLVLMQLLPALVQADLDGFGAALSEVQRITGAWFAPQQGGVFAPGPGEDLIRHLAGWGAAGVGQSSWGPAVYGLVEGEAAGVALAARCRQFLGGDGVVFEGGFARSGARLGRGGPPSEND
jgi:beta-ribofuranosylaminobenzene 5'-phosphate synthase